MVFRQDNNSELQWLQAEANPGQAEAHPGQEERPMSVTSPYDSRSTNRQTPQRAQASPERHRQVTRPAPTAATAATARPKRHTPQTKQRGRVNRGGEQPRPAPKRRDQQKRPASGRRKTRERPGHHPHRHANRQADQRTEKLHNGRSKNASRLTQTASHGDENQGSPAHHLETGGEGAGRGRRRQTTTAAQSTTCKGALYLTEREVKSSRRERVLAGRTSLDGEMHATQSTLQEANVVRNTKQFSAENYGQKQPREAGARRSSPEGQQWRRTHSARPLRPHAPRGGRGGDEGRNPEPTRGRGGANHAPRDDTKVVVQSRAAGWPTSARKESGRDGYGVRFPNFSTAAIHGPPRQRRRQRHDHGPCTVLKLEPAGP